ncbi:MAG: hypothetical protein HN368_04990 [Spirochaetales bacterium]|jgi:uncharacterized protein (DUF608 family)|nr:hypothetical protein [Spirochaetales bacterium]
MSSLLFPTDIPERKVSEFFSKSYGCPVSGIRFTSDNLPARGVPLGGIGTGCIDLEADGTFGQCSIFNSLKPRRGQLNLPFLGLTVGRSTWLLSTLPVKGYEASEFYDPAAAKVTPVFNQPTRIHYFGHYPVVDAEFELDCPVSVGLRSWSPFILGDTEVSNTPAAVFEVNLRNTTENPQAGKVLFSFPGPSPEETLGNGHFTRRKVQGGFSGAVVTNDAGPGYALGVVWKDNNSYDMKGLGTDSTLQIGGELGMDGGAWSRAGAREANPFSMLTVDLPENVNQPGVSVRVSYNLEPGEDRTIRYVLAWYAPEWKAGGRPEAGGNSFYHKYAERFAGPREVAEFVAQNHELLLKRIIAWQEVIYSEDQLPPFLRDYLVNILYLQPEVTMWAQALPPIGDWCRQKDGLYFFNNCANSYPITASMSDNYTSEFPQAMFFPDLIRSVIRGYKAYQFPSGAAPWAFGGLTNRTGVCEITKPTPGYQTVTNGTWLAAAVDRLWNSTGDDTVIQEFYPMIKKNVEFTMGLNRGPDGVASMPDRIVSAEFPMGERETEWFEMNGWYGIVTHIAGARIAQLNVAIRMADLAGDTEFALKCRDWREQASNTIEDNMWEDNRYLTYLDKENDLRSDVVFANTFDGETLTILEGLPPVFKKERRKKMLETIKRLNLKGDFFAPILYVTPEGEPVRSGVENDSEVNWAYDEYDFRLYVVIFFLIQLIDNGDSEMALDIVQKYYQKVICEKGLSWCNPEHTEGKEMIPFNFEDVHNSLIWAMPVALIDGNIRTSCSPGGFVYRIKEAAKSHMIRAME